MLRVPVLGSLFLVLTLPPVVSTTSDAKAQVAGSSPTVQQNLWVTNGRVRTTALFHNTLYVGGDFTYVGPATGGGAALSTSTGSPDLRLPRINGEVRAVRPDGAGGWYVGGQFTLVGGIPRSNAVHIRSDRSVDPAWKPNPTGPNKFVTYGVQALAVHGATVYLGGNFVTVGGTRRANLGAVDATDGTVASWNPGANRPVSSLTVKGATLYVGGQFTTIAGQRRNAIAAFDLATAGLTLWHPGFRPHDFVDAIAVRGQTVYVGGAFGVVGGQQRNNAAALDATTAQPTGWKPDPSGYVNALLVYGSVVYVGGIFNSVQGAFRDGAAAVDALTGAPTSFNADALLQNVLAFTVVGTTLYAGGTVQAGPDTRDAVICAFNASTGKATGYTVSTGDRVYALAGVGATLFAGGLFTSAGGVDRTYVAALDLTTGRATAWNPVLDGGVLGVAASSQSLYVVGGFATIGGAYRPYIGEIRLDTGQPTSFEPPGQIYPPASADAVAVAGNKVYVGGSFVEIGSAKRRALLALDAATGALTSWNPGVGSGGISTFCVVCAMVIRNGLLIAGGTFANVGTVSRNNLAAVSLATGESSTWNPDVRDPNGGAFGVYALALGTTSLYIGGIFATVGGQPRSSLAEVDLATGRPTRWNPCGACRLAAVAVLGSAVYAAGDQVTPLGSTDYTHSIEAFDRGTGALLSWDPQPTGLFSSAASVNEVDVLTPVPSLRTLFIGGAFTDVVQDGGRSGIAGLSAAK